MEFRSRSMRTRSSALSSRFARSATWATSLSETFIGEGLALPDYELYPRDWLGDVPVDRRHVLWRKRFQFVTPARVRDLYPEYALAEVECAGAGGDGRSASQRPCEKRTLAWRSAPNAGAHNFVQGCCDG